MLKTLTTTQTPTSFTASSSSRTITCKWNWFDVAHTTLVVASVLLFMVALPHSCLFDVVLACRDCVLGLWWLVVSVRTTRNERRCKHFLSYCDIAPAASALQTSYFIIGCCSWFAVHRLLSTSLN
jgi:hypothetical protein